MFGTFDLKTAIPRRDVPGWLFKNFGYRCTVNVLANLASDGTGPPYRRLNGQAIYDPADLIEWVATRIPPAYRRARDARKAEVAHA